MAVIVAVAFANEKLPQKRSADDKVEVQHGTLNYQTVSLPKEDKTVTLLNASPVVSYEVPVEQNYIKSAEIVPTLAHTTLLQPQVVPQVVPVQQQVVHQVPVQQAVPRYAYYSVHPQQQSYYPSYPAVIPRQAAYYYPQQYQQQYYANSVPQYVKYVR